MLEQAKQKIKNDLDIVDGQLRIAFSSDLGRNLAIPWLDEFMDTYPAVSLRRNISDSNIDFSLPGLRLVMTISSVWQEFKVRTAIMNQPLVSLGKDFF